ncbi:MAG: glutamate--tRNA ligase, partial [Victivallaceae bacterium]|nr:glutamate--tRNA ligase [Victivallaceae bacterium]
AFLLARSQHGKFILRIEDTDRQRLVENAVEVIYRTLAAAGLDHDEGPDKDGGFGPYVQSERKDIYPQYAQKLVESGHAYYCFCEKNDTVDEDNPGAGGYDGHCRNLDPAVVRQYLSEKRPYVIRQKIDPNGVSTFSDLVFGEISIENKVLDDQILLKRDGMPTYNFANVIDDHLMGITHVVRGAEYLPSTPKYNLLYRAFSWEIPQYVHLPLIMGRDADGVVAKLSKRHGSVSFENLVAEGYLPSAIINYIALLGWSPKNDREIFSLTELEELFSVAGLNKSPAVFDYAKLDWMNGEYIKQLPFEDFVALATPFAGLQGTALEAKAEGVLKLVHQRISRLNEIPGKISFLLAQPDYELDLYNHKKSKSCPEAAQRVLPELRNQLAALGSWDFETIAACLNAYAETHEVKSALVNWVARIAITGLAVTPGGAYELMVLLGREESLARLDRAIAKLNGN